MANSITLFKNYLSLIDEVYQTSSLTGFLDGNPDLVQAGANANELVIPKMSMQGLGSYSRSSGYVSGDVTMTNETVSCNFDRGRMFTIDSMDNIETAGVAFGRLAGEFERTKVVPELDAFRISKYAQVSGISTVDADDLTTGADVLAALRAAVSTMDSDEVPYENRILFIEGGLMGLVEDLDTTKSRAVIGRFQQIVRMPQSRLYTKITQYDGSTSGQEAGGYIKDVSIGKNINFLIVHKDAVIQFSKHIAPKIVTPEANPDADAYKFGYRHVALADVYDNKVAGIYLHKATT